MSEQNAPVDIPTQTAQDAAPSVEPTPANNPPAPVVETPPSEGAPPPAVEENKTDQGSLLGDLAKGIDAPSPAEEADKGGEQEKEQASQSDEPAPLPAYESFTLPEDFTADNEKLAAFTKELGEFENLTKADHAEVQKFGQKLVDRYVAELQDTVKRIGEAQQVEWDRVKSAWKGEIEKDPELGGNRRETTRTNIQKFLQQYGGTTEERKAFSDLMTQTGIGDFLPLARMIARAGESLSEGRPLAAGTPVAAQKSAYEKRYGGSS